MRGGKEREERGGGAGTRACIYVYYQLTTVLHFVNNSTLVQSGRIIVGRYQTGCGVRGHVRERGGEAAGAVKVQLCWLCGSGSTAKGRFWTTVELKFPLG